MGASLPPWVWSDLSQPSVYISLKTHSKSDKEFPLNSAPVYTVCLLRNYKDQPHMRSLSFFLEEKYTIFCLQNVWPSENLLRPELNEKQFIVGLK